MAEPHVDAIRGIYERWAEGDFRTGDVFDPMVVLVLQPEFPDAGAYLGVDGVAEYMRGLLGAWGELTIEAEEITAAGDSVVVALRQRAVGKGSGAVTELRYFQVWSFRGDRAIRLESVRERADAFALVTRPPASSRAD